jgi:DNA-binding transcriptional LysR family regulator
LRLFHRTTHSIALTEEGDRLLESGRELIAGLDRFGDALGGVAAGRGSGRVRVTAPASFARACILPALPAFLAANPGLEIEVKFRNELLDLAAEGVDIALRTGALDGLPGHRAQKLFAFPWIACAAPAYLARGVPKTPADLAAHDHVGFRNPATGQILTWRFADPRSRATLRFTPKPRHIFDDAHAATGLMREGFGVGWGPAWLFGDDLREPEEPLWLLRSSHRQAPERTRRAMAFLASLPQSWRV